MNWISRITLSSRIHARARVRLVDYMLEKTKPPRGGDALEIGCGAGFVSAHVVDSYGMRVMATDADEEMLGIAKRKNGGRDELSFMVADAMALPLDDTAFDLVLAQNMMHHVPDWRKVVDEIARVMRPGGLFLMSDISGPSTAMKMFAHAGEDHGFRKVDELIERLATHSLTVVRRDSPEKGHGNEFAILFRKA